MRRPAREGERAVRPVMLQVISREPDPDEHGHQRERGEEVHQRVVLPLDEHVPRVAHGPVAGVVARLVEEVARLLGAVVHRGGLVHGEAVLVARHV